MLRMNARIPPHRRLINPADILLLLVQSHPAAQAAYQLRARDRADGFAASRRTGGLSNPRVFPLFGFGASRRTGGLSKRNSTFSTASICIPPHRRLIQSSLRWYQTYASRHMRGLLFFKKCCPNWASSRKLILSQKFGTMNVVSIPTEYVAYQAMSPSISLSRREGGLSSESYTA